MENLAPYKRQILPFNNSNRNAPKFQYRASHYQPPPNTKLNKVIEFAQEKSNRMKSDFGQTDGSFFVNVKLDNGKWISTRSSKPGERIKGLQDYDGNKLVDNVVDFRIVYTFKN